LLTDFIASREGQIAREVLGRFVSFRAEWGKNRALAKVMTGSQCTFGSSKTLEIATLFSAFSAHFSALYTMGHVWKFLALLCASITNYGALLYYR
jgi:hypothetical protein